MIRFFIAVGLMLSPRTLSALGNAAGSAGALYLPLLALVAGWYFSVAASWKEASRPEIPYSFLGRLSTFYVPAARWYFFVLYAASVTALAGYIFNEVFVYWFPNFAFTFILLGAICLINMLPDSKSRQFQIGFAALAIFGIGHLAVTGVVTPPAEAVAQIAPAGSSTLDVICLFLIVLFGFDMAFTPWTDRPDASSSSAKAGIVVMTGLLGLFAWTSLTHVPWERLANLGVPHMAAARSLLDEPGRVIMGAAAIFGAAAALNALLSSIVENFRDLSEREFLPYSFSQGPKPRVLLVLVTFLVVSGILLAGYAGEDILETLILSGFAAWFVGHALTCADALFNRYNGLNPMVPAVGLAGSLIAPVLLYFFAADKGVYLLFSLGAVGAILTLSVILQPEIKADEKV